MVLWLKWGSHQVQFLKNSRWFQNPFSSLISSELSSQFSNSRRSHCIHSSSSRMQCFNCSRISSNTQGSSHHFRIAWLLLDRRLVGFRNLRGSHLTRGSQESTIQFRATSAFQVDCWVASPSNSIQSFSSSNGIASVKSFQVWSVRLTIIPEIDQHCNARKRGRTIISTGNEGEYKSIIQLH